MLRGVGREREGAWWARGRGLLDGVEAECGAEGVDLAEVVAVVRQDVGEHVVAGVGVAQGGCDSGLCGFEACARGGPGVVGVIVDLRPVAPVEFGIVCGVAGLDAVECAFAPVDHVEDLLPDGVAGPVGGCRGLLGGEAVEALGPRGGPEPDVPRLVEGLGDECAGFGVDWRGWLGRHGSGPYRVVSVSRCSWSDCAVSAST